MITTAEYIRERTRAEVAEAKVRELQAEIQKLQGFTDCEPEVQPEPESKDVPE